MRLEGQKVRVHTQVFKCQQIESYPVNKDIAHKVALVNDGGDRVEMVFYSAPPFEIGRDYAVTFET